MICVEVGRTGILSEWKPTVADFRFQNQGFQGRKVGERQEMNTAAAAKSLQSCSTLCYPINSSPLSSSVPAILQARILEWVAISFSNSWKWKVKVKLLSRVRLLATPWTAAYQAPPSMGFSRQEYWSGVPLPSPRNEWIGLNIQEHMNWNTGNSFWLAMMISFDFYLK